jgi:hypothetical protein
MIYNNSFQVRTFKIEKDSDFADDDIKWIESLSNVSVVTVQNKIMRVRTESEDTVVGIVDSINTRYCTCSNPKLSPLFCILIPAPPKHKN